MAAICAKCNVEIVADSPGSRSGHCPSCGMAVGTRHATKFPNCAKCKLLVKYFEGSGICRAGHSTSIKPGLWKAIEHGEIRCPYFEEAA